MGDAPPGHHLGVHRLDGAAGAGNLETVSAAWPAAAPAASCLAPRRGAAPVRRRGATTPRSRRIRPPAPPRRPSRRRSRRPDRGSNAAHPTTTATTLRSTARRLVAAAPTGSRPPEAGAGRAGLGSAPGFARSREVGRQCRGGGGDWLGADGSPDGLTRHGGGPGHHRCPVVVLRQCPEPLGDRAALAVVVLPLTAEVERPEFRPCSC